MQNGNITIIIAAILGIALLGGVYIATQSSSKDTDAMPQNDSMHMKNDTITSDDTTMKDEAMMQKETSALLSASNAMMQKDEGAMISAEVSFTGTILAGSSSPLLEYNDADYQTAIKSGKLVVLFFYAEWCPTCKAEFPLMQQAFDSYSGSDVVGFRVHYNDSATTSSMQTLAKEHGVAYQHTKVFIKNSTRVGKSPENWNTQQYLSAFAQYK